MYISFFLLQGFLVCTHSNNERKKGMDFGRAQVSLEFSGMRWKVDVSNIIVCRNIKIVLVLLFYFFTAHFTSFLPCSVSVIKNRESKVEFSSQI